MFIRSKRTKQQAIIEGHGALICSVDDGGEDGGGGSGDDEGSKDDQGDGDSVSAAEFNQLKADLEAATSELARWKAKREEEAKHRREAEEKAARNKGDVEALDKSWKEKEQAWIDERDGYIEHANRRAVETTATKLASKLAIKGSESVLERVISDRLVAETTKLSDPTVIRVLDGNGKPSALTLDELEKELQNDTALAPILVGSRASGAGGSNPSAGGGGSKIRNSELQKLSPKARAKYFKDNPNAEVIDD